MRAGHCYHDHQNGGENALLIVLDFKGDLSESSDPFKK